jgi:ADP-heptose:LPS heptosyltransferase
MSSILERAPRGERVAVIRLRSLGDCVLTTPAIRILKRSRPDLRIGISVESRFAAVFAANPDVECVLPPVASAVRRFRPWLCLNLHGGARSALITALSGARVRAGFGHFRYPWLYNLRIPSAQRILGVERTVHTAEHLASAVFYLGAPRVEIPPATLFGARRAVQPVAVLHPVASHPAKVWPASRFLAVAGYLKDSCGLDPVFIAATREELRPFHAWRTLAGAPLPEIADLLAGAALFIGNDSGPAHMAAALGVPVVVLFGPSDPRIWGPWKAVGKALTGPSGIDSIQTADVVAALSRLGVCA